MRHSLPALITACALLALPAMVAATGFAGRPTLLSAEGGAQHAAWVAYENGDVMRCRADTGDCQTMRGLPAFAKPVSLSAEPDQAAAWLGLSDGTLYRCSDAGRCAPITLPGGTDPASNRPAR
jgi:hypothetical protein